MKYRHRISSASTSVRKISLKVLINVRGCVACKNWYRVIITYAASLMMSLTAQLLTCCAALTDAFSKSHWPISSRQTLRRGHHCSLNTDVVYPAVTLTGYARLRVVMEFHRGAARAACRRSCDINGKLGSIPIGLGSFKQDGSIRRRPSLRQGPKPKEAEMGLLRFFSDRIGVLARVTSSHFSVITGLSDNLQWQLCSQNSYGCWNYGVVVLCCFNS